MSLRRFRNAEFRRAGEVGSADLPLPRTKRRDLDLQRGWADAAGASVARRVRAVGIRRGVLEAE